MNDSVFNKQEPLLKETPYFIEILFINISCMFLFPLVSETESESEMEGIVIVIAVKVQVELKTQMPSYHQSMTCSQWWTVME